MGSRAVRMKGRSGVELSAARLAGVGHADVRVRPRVPRAEADDFELRRRSPRRVCGFLVQVPESVGAGVEELEPGVAHRDDGRAVAQQIERVLRGRHSHLSSTSKT